LFFDPAPESRAPQACVPRLQRVCVAWGARGRARSCGRSPWRASPAAPTARYMYSFRAVYASPAVLHPAFLSTPFGPWVVSGVLWQPAVPFLAGRCVADQPAAVPGTGRAGQEPPGEDRRAREAEPPCATTGRPTPRRALPRQRGCPRGGTTVAQGCRGRPRDRGGAVTDGAPSDPWQLAHGRDWRLPKPERLCRSHDGWLACLVALLPCCT